jgi:hypothetical protein
MREVYVALGMGVQRTPESIRRTWLQAIQSQFPPPQGFSNGPLPERSLAASGTGAKYGPSLVYLKRYDTSALPSESDLSRDLISITKLLRRLGDSGQFRVADVPDDTGKVSVRVHGRDFEFSAADVERAFAVTQERHWLDLPGSEPVWHVVVGDQSKPLKAVFRNMPGVPTGFQFTKDEAARAFRRLGYDVVDTSPNGEGTDESELCLLGTWRGVEADVERVRGAIVSKKAWASWWSFPIREEFREQLGRSFFLYINAGGERISHRMKVADYRTARGNDGLPSPWPDITDATLVGKVREGPSTSQVFKTWLRITALETIQPPLSLDDFEPAPGTQRTALLNQAAFGYAYRKEGRARAPNSASATNEDDPVNLILYGPPGTGKTHWLREKFAEYSDSPTEVDSETWLHDLVAKFGWRPVIASTLADLGRASRVPEIQAHPWVQAKIKQRGRTASVLSTLWGMLMGHTPEGVETVKYANRRPPFVFSKNENAEWELLEEWEDLDEESAELFGSLKAGPAAASKPIQRYKVVTFHPSFSYEDFVRGIRPVATDEGGTTQFRTVDGIFKLICDEARGNSGKRYALFIDEINRANIAKVFGELITLLETDKRVRLDAAGRIASGMTVQLPGGDGSEVAEPAFGVPANLDIYGTMNTADRSIALLDVALRRRFHFREMEPDYQLLNRSLGNVQLDQLLRRINDRLEYLLDRDHRVGHAYLMPAQSLADLRRVFHSQIIPLLQEFFFDDLTKVAMVLSTNPSAPPFVTRYPLRHTDLFVGPRSESLPAERDKYVVTPEGTWTEASFSGIYEKHTSSASDRPT